MRTTLDLPDALFRDLKSRAALRGLTMKDLLAELVADGLRASGPRAAPARRSPLPVARQAGRGPRIPARRNAELQRLLDAEDAKRHAGR